MLNPCYWNLLIMWVIANAHFDKILMMAQSNDMDINNNNMDTDNAAKESGTVIHEILEFQPCLTTSGCQRQFLQHFQDFLPNSTTNIPHMPPKTNDSKARSYLSSCFPESISNWNSWGHTSSSNNRTWWIWSLLSLYDLPEYKSEWNARPWKLMWCSRLGDSI